MDELKPCRLDECRPGLFMFEEMMGFKTEYGAQTGKNIGGGRVEWKVTHWPDAYCVETGEFFWGGAKTHEDRAALIVQPIGAKAALQSRPADNTGLVGEFERWSDIRDDADAIVSCVERWTGVAEILGCTLHGFNDGLSASFTTPDGNIIEIGPKFRAAITALRSNHDEEVPPCPTCGHTDASAIIAALQKRADEVVEKCAEMASKRHREWEAAIEGGLGRVAVSKDYAEGAMIEAEIMALKLNALKESSNV